MADFKITMAADANNPVVGDLYLENGTVRLTGTLAEEVAQLLWIRFQWWLGEWFLDTTQGMPYQQTILGQKTPIGIIQQIYKRLIVTCPGVSALTSFSLKKLTGRAIQIIFACKLADGTTLNSSNFGAFIVGVPNA